MSSRHEFFGNKVSPASVRGVDLEQRIRNALAGMIRKTGGLGEAALHSAVDRELSRKVAKWALNYLAKEGVKIESARVLDLGAGLGSLSLETALRGARVVAVEPGEEFREIVFDRLRPTANGTVVGAIAEQLPFPGRAFDVVISLQVLEHVQDPASMLKEVFRVLKPDGLFYLTCENYLSFWEPHYQVAWLPLLPKSIGSMYLRLRGRPSEFLQTSITYTTLPSVLRMIRRCGFISVKEQRVSSLMQSPNRIRTPWKRELLVAAHRFVPLALVGRAYLGLQRLTKMFRPGILELLQKPGPRSGSQKDKWFQEQRSIR